MSHHCHAYLCEKTIPPSLLFCLKHWRMTPKKLQAEIWRTYRRGQEDDKDPSPEYLLAQRACVWAVFVAENGCTWPEVPQIGSREFMIGPASIAGRDGGISQ